MTVAGSVGCVADQTGRARRAAASDDLRDPVILLLLLAVQWISVGRDCSAWAGIVHPGLSSSALPPATEPFGKREKVAAPGGGAEARARDQLFRRSSWPQPRKRTRIGRAAIGCRFCGLCLEP